jgi:hypothetical protein
MGRPSLIPDVVEKETTDNPVELDVTPKQAEVMGLIVKAPKKPRSEKQIEATKKLIEKNKAWRAKLKEEKASGSSDNMIQGLLAEKVDEKEEKKSTKIRYRIKKPKVHPRPNHALKRKAEVQALPEDSDVGATSEVAESSGLDTDAVVEELRARVFPPASGKRFLSLSR